MPHHHNLRDSPLQEAGSTELNKFNPLSKINPWQTTQFDP